jgi:hypothetical protein
VPYPPPPRRLLTSVTLLALAACGGGDGGADPIVEPPLAAAPATMPAAGLGAVPSRFTAEVTVRGPYAYTSTWGLRGTVRGSVVYVWDVSGAVPALRDSVQVDPNPASPTVGTTGDVQVTDDGRWLVVATEPTGTLVIYSLADPARPALAARYTTPDLAAGVHTAQVSRVNGKLYAFCALDPRGATPAKLAIVDLSDPTAPRQVWVRAMGAPYVHDTYVRDGWLVTANWDAGITVWDIGARGRGTPESPDSVGAVRTVNGQAHNVWWGRDPADGSTRWAVVGEEGPGSVGNSALGDVHVIDMADPSKPREVAVFAVPGAGTHNFSVDAARGILYAAYYNAGVRALDIRGDLGTCTAAQRTADGRCDLARMGRELGRGLDGRAGGVYVWGVEYVPASAGPGGDAVYASDMLGGLWKLGPVTR